MIGLLPIFFEEWESWLRVAADVKLISCLSFFLNNALNSKTNTFGGVKWCFIDKPKSLFEM